MRARRVIFAGGEASQGGPGRPVTPAGAAEAAEEEEEGGGGSEEVPCDGADTSLRARLVRSVRASVVRTAVVSP